MVGSKSTLNSHFRGLEEEVAGDYDIYVERSYPFIFHSTNSVDIPWFLLRISPEQKAGLV